MRYRLIWPAAYFIVHAEIRFRRLCLLSIHINTLFQQPIAPLAVQYLVVVCLDCYLYRYTILIDITGGQSTSESYFRIDTATAVSSTTYRPDVDNPLSPDLTRVSMRPSVCPSVCLSLAIRHVSSGGRCISIVDHPTRQHVAEARPTARRPGSTSPIT